ncbi:MAG: hypothetical protein AAF228_03355 [Pseudomonadota bacterium]
MSSAYSLKVYDAEINRFKISETSEANISFLDMQSFASQNGAAAQPQSASPGPSPFDKQQKLNILNSLEEKGFSNGNQILDIMRKWHENHYHITDSAQAKQFMFDFQPALLQALSQTANPDKAFVLFDRFLSNLKTEQKFLSLFKNNASALRLIIDVMGNAPHLAQFLYWNPKLLESILDPASFDSVPTDYTLKSSIYKVISNAQKYEDIVNGLRYAVMEQAFLISLRVLSQKISAQQAGVLYTRLAEILIEALLLYIEHDLRQNHGSIKGGQTTVLAMGKLGSWELTASSDLDLIVIYDFDKSCTESDGKKPISPLEYYNLLTKKLIKALSIQTSYGNLYKVDMRLRPWGNSSSVATHIDSFAEYQEKQAWTWEHMALTRARVITGSEDLRPRVEGIVHSILCHPRNPRQISADIIDMRSRIAKEKPTNHLWNIKYVRGGLIDLEFIVQYLQLIHANTMPEILHQNIFQALQNIKEANIIEADISNDLIMSAEYYHSMMQILRICISDMFDPDKAPEGLKDVLVRISGKDSFSELENNLKMTTESVKQIYNQTLKKC